MSSRNETSGRGDATPRRRCRMSMSSSFFSQLLSLYLLLYKYFLMTLQPKFDLNVHVTHKERERERMQKEPPGQKNKKWKTNFTLNNAVFPFPPTPICIRNLSGATGVPGLHRTEQGWASSSLGWLQQLQMAA